MIKSYATFLAALALGSTPALAQTAPPPTAPAETTVAPVTVTATSKPEVIEKQSFETVKKLAAPANPVIGQIARWRDPVCAAVVGLPREDQAAAIKDRIESVAQAVGLPAAGPKCIANVEVVFSPDPQATMDAVAQRKDFLLGYFHAHQRDHLKRVTHAIQSWYVTSTKGDGTGVVEGAFTKYAEYSNFKTEQVDDPELPPPNGCAGSRIGSTCLESRLRNVFIIADSKAINGKDTGPVADDITLLALAEPRSLDGCNDLPSVIDNFAKTPCTGRDPPGGLTPADAAYLTALYQANLRNRTATEQADIANRMAKILIGAKGAGK